MGGALASVFGLGESLLRPATRQRQAAQHGLEGSGFQVDPHSVSLLEGSQALLRRDPPMDATQICDVDLVITSYGALLRAPWMIEVPWRLAVLDKAQAIGCTGPAEDE